MKDLILICKASDRDSMGELCEKLEDYLTRKGEVDICIRSEEPDASDVTSLVAERATGGQVICRRNGETVTVCAENMTLLWVAVQLLLRDGMTIPGVKNHDRNDLALQASASATSFAENGKPQNVINGKIWANDGKDYAWISDAALPQSIELKFEAPKKVREVRITFDIPFSEYRYGYMEQPSAARMVTDFTLSVLTENGWIDSHRITDNRDRLVVLEMEPTVTSAIRITVCKTLREAIAVIPEIRIYE